MSPYISPTRDNRALYVRLLCKDREISELLDTETGGSIINLEALKAIHGGKK